MLEQILDNLLYATPITNMQGASTLSTHMLHLSPEPHPMIVR